MIPSSWTDHSIPWRPVQIGNESTMTGTNAIISYLLLPLLLCFIAIFKSTNVVTTIFDLGNENGISPVPSIVRDENHSLYLDHRPWMILHVGPPKTGTTTIQNGLEKLALRLAKEDNIYFIGSVLKDIKSVGGINGEPNVTMFRVKDFLHSTPTEAFLQVLKNHQREGHNVLVSSEHFSSDLINRPEYWQNLFENIFLSTRTSTDHIPVHEESFFGFNVKIVVTYRHFFQWLPSYWAQWHNLLRTIGPPSGIRTKNSANESGVLYPYEHYIPGIIEYTQWFVRNTLKHIDSNTDHTAYSQQFPNPTRGDERAALPTSHGSVWSYLHWSSTPALNNRVDVFDFHQHPDPFVFKHSNQTNPRRNFVADFVCQMLPNATNTCQYLIEHTVDSDFRKRVKESPSTRIVSDQDMHRIKQMARKQGRVLKMDSAVLQKPSVVVTKWFRKQARLNRTQNLRRCLDKISLNRLRDVSWSFFLHQIELIRRHDLERKRLALTKPSYQSLFRSTVPTNHQWMRSRSLDNERHNLTLLLKDKHDQSFDKHVKQGVFCEVDVDALFKDTGFIQYALV